MYSENCLLWNPKSMEEIQLPLLKKFYSHNSCVLSKAPTEVDCHIMFNLDYAAADECEQSYCKIGDDAFKVFTRDQWNDITRDQWDDEIMLRAMRSFKGRIYGVVGTNAMPNGLVSMDFDADDLMNIRPVLDFGDHELDLDSWCDDYLVQCDDEVLFLVRRKKLFGDYCEFRLFRVDPDRMECVEVDGIDDRTIFVSDCGDAFCCSSSLSKTNSNTIYYAPHLTKTLYVYDLDDGSTTNLLTSLDVPRGSRNFGVADVD
ncbi:hypothetical protein C2S52_000551 [Perilla frutescens var. hirtella]|nr:hypothetical protein C2S52_000551 [Perilla frutescens var. hirtella]